MSGPNQAIGLNGRLAARWARRAVDRLRKERVEIDELNVFPVPDGDTGTNMYHTLRAAYLAVEELTGPVTLPQVVAALAEGAGRGARGNSGLILAVALKGVADALEGVTVATPEAMAAALELASARARQSVARPVDGTMLTVLDAMATEAAEKAENGANLIDLISAVRLRSRSALRETTGQLPVLREAEVVDAGSTGIVELFDLLYATVTGRTPQDSMLGEVTRSPRIVHQASADELEIVAILATYPASTDSEKTNTLAEVLDDLGGTSIVINGPKVHVHVADEATAVTILDHLAGYGIARLDMEDLRLHEEEGETHLVAIVSGTGLLMHCALNGASALTPDFGDVRAMTRDIIAEEDRAVIVVPSSTTVLKALGQVSGGQVVRSRNFATLLSALTVHDPFAPSAEIFADMTEAAAGTRVGTIVSAEQLALNPPTGALPVIDDVPGAGSEPGSMLDSSTVGMRRIPLSHPSQFYRVFIDGKVKTQSTELTTLVEKLADRLLGAGGELLTVVHGPGCAPDVLSHLRDWIRKSHSQVRFQDIDSRDRATLLIMGVE
ncbi:DAK2 domain-containing protein [Brevibacterium sp. RIT 803]|uniref:DAK2 domain-containing protein n=1 Tax=Brevibacterium sp. RIT 803 TaxID=2810210 RepID=UPI00194DE04B|nr:DAK2 domain-containing protein [Brevibacterium sp. RIT 803]MBM6588605.1 DAK2 domain-containing protein [Brevibacterium sp. RIT 803]